MKFLVEYDVGCVVVAISYKANAFLPKGFNRLVLEFQFDLVCSHDNIIYTDLLRIFIINEQLYKINFKWYNYCEDPAYVSEQQVKNVELRRCDVFSIA